MRWDVQATLTHDHTACYSQVVPRGRIRTPELHGQQRGDSTRFGVEGGNQQCWKGLENSYFIHTGQMREFASHSASMMLRHCSSNCKLFSYSLMMDCSTRQWTGGALHHAAPSCPVFSANFTFKGFIHPRKIQVNSCYQSLVSYSSLRLPLVGFLLSCPASLCEQKR